MTNCELPVHAVGPAYTHYRYAPELLGWLRANVHRFNTVIVNGIWQYHAQAVWRTSRELHFQYFVFTHGMLDPYFKRRYPAKHLRKLGMVSGDLKWGALSACEAFVLPSHEENFGIAVVEAMACRMAVLTSTEVNIWREIDADGGSLVAPDKAEGAVSLIERWTALSTSERRFIGERAQACVERRFTIEGAAARLRGLLAGSAQVDGVRTSPMAAAE